ncbi:MAG TPA: sugar phosphotransferase [Myxococcales bacterium]
MADLDLDALPAWLSTRRWFGGKGRPIASVRVADEARLRHLRVLTLEVAYRSGPSPERYLVPLREGMDVPLEEALDEESCRIVFGILRERREVRTREGVLRGERFDAQGSALDALPERPGVRRLSAEQSNTSLVFGDAVILKLIRKLVPGRNPELEVGALLARRGFRSTPALLAALTLSNDVEATIGVAHRFVQVDCDGWSYVLEALARDGGASVALLEEVRELGARVGEMHVALADPDDPAFAPEPVARDDLQRWSRTLLSELEETVKVASSAVPGLAAKAPELRSRIARLAEAKPSGVRLRQHGDLHLGQVLRSQGEWLIFDFEGEPARPVSERRQKHAPWKDVAGMLRSFAYAAAAAEKRGAPAIPREPLRRAFLDGYRSRASPLLPGDPATAQALLDSLELEKLLYELRYEVGHRPDWVGIPARDLLQEAP